MLVVVGRHVGECFDDACLDALLLAMPVFWKGKLAQNAGRLHPARREVMHYDYVNHVVLKKCSCRYCGIIDVLW